jgi:hypothetical protein
MNKRFATLATGVCLVAASLTGPVTSADASGAADSASRAAVPRLTATLRGGPDGDPNGKGRATFRMYKKAGKVCANVTYSRIGTPNAAHIHRKTDGGIVVDLVGSVTGGPVCNRTVSRPLVKRILQHPRRYYFNVHNARYPAGAIQGTLHH